MHNGRCVEILKKNAWLHFYQMQAISLSQPTSAILSRAEGIYVFDQNGKKYIDALSGAYCVNVGYGRDRILQAALSAGQKIHYVSPFSAANIPAITLAGKLSHLARFVLGDDSRVFFVNSGAEAVETAIKIARAYSRRTSKPDGYKIICRNFAYHGTMLGSMSFCGDEDIRAEYGPTLPGVYHAPNTFCARCSLGLKRESCGIACANSILNTINKLGQKSVAAVLIEPLETSSGIVPPPPGYLHRVYNICQQTDTLLILDEVLTGFGRLSHWFGAERYNLKADIIACAKGLTSGYDSLGAVIVRKEIADVFLGDDNQMFKHASTFGGRPAAAAAALETIAIIEEEDLLHRAEMVSLYLRNLLRNRIEILSCIGEIRNDGLLFGIDLINSEGNLMNDIKKINFIRTNLLENGLITSMYYNRHEPIIELAPPLTISFSQCDEMVDIIHKTLCLVC